MTRIVLETTFFFLLPTLAYVAYIAFKRTEWPGLGPVLAGAPLVKLFCAGAVLMFATIILLSHNTGHPPKEAYSPPSYRDGAVTPGHGAKGER